MPRSVPEWVADHPDQAIPKRVKLRIWEREGGRCSLTNRKIMPGDTYEFEHRIALACGGEHRESNIVLALSAPHKLKTADDVALKAKIQRVSLKHRGLWPRSPFKLKGRGFPKRVAFAGRATPEDAAEDGSREAQRSGGTTPIQTPSPTQKERER